MRRKCARPSAAPDQSAARRSAARRWGPSPLGPRPRVARLPAAAGETRGRLRERRGAISDKSRTSARAARRSFSSRCAAASPRPARRPPSPPLRRRCRPSMGQAGPSSLESDPNGQERKNTFLDAEGARGATDTLRTRLEHPESPYNPGRRQSFPPCSSRPSTATCPDPSSAISFFITSKSLGGKVGSRRIWRTISRTAGRLARLVSTVNVIVPSPWLPNPRSIRIFIPVPSRATFLSSKSWICWRLRFLVPRIISPARKPLASPRPLRLSLLP